MPNKMLHHCCLVALSYAGGPNPAALDMRGVNSQDIAFPLACGKSRPSMLRVCRRVRTTVHVNRAESLSDLAVHFNGDESLRMRITLLPNPIVSGSGIEIGRSVSGALMLQQGN